MMKVKVYQSEFNKVITNKYTYFFVSIVVLLFLSPVVSRHALPLMSVFFLIVMLSLLWALKLKRKVFTRFVIIALLGFLSNFLAGVKGVMFKEPYMAFQIIALFFYILFLVIVILLLLNQIFTEKRVTGDTLCGGISIYFLMGFLWAMCFQLLLVINPDAIFFSGGQKDLSELIYFSFTTLTTVGYGDLLPASGMARSLSSLEATLGQVFITVFIARLVGLSLRKE
jgi:hypothetical protein